MIHNRKARIAARRAEALQEARLVLQEVAGGSLDAHEGYRAVYGIYLNSSGLAEELKPVLRLPGVEPDGFLHVNEDFRAMIRRLADEWLRGDWPRSRRELQPASHHIAGAFSTLAPGHPRA